MHRATVLILVLVLVISPLGTPMPGPTDGDAGTGGDAPDQQGDQVRLEPERVYEGTLSGTLGDASDWYAFDAQAGRVLHVAFQGDNACLEIVDPAGDPASHDLCRGGPFEGGQTLEVPANGTWYLHIVPGEVLSTPTTYDLAFAFDKSPPVLADHHLEPVPEPPVPEDDAGTGEDAPNHGSDRITLQDGRVYQGNLTEVVTTFPQDWYAFQARTGQEVELAVAATPEACVSLVDPQGRRRPYPSTCTFGGATARTTPLELPHNGTWYLRFTSLTPATYAFSLGVGEAAPDPGGLLEFAAPENPALPTPRDATQGGPHTVVAVVDTGINPYHGFFRAENLTEHPSTWLPGFPAGAETLNITLNASSYEDAVRADEATWGSIQHSTYRAGADAFDTHLYTFPGTRVVGAVSFGEYDGSVGGPEETGFPVLDEAGHGTMTASLAAGANLTRPEGNVLVVMVAVDTDDVEEGVRWAGRQPWIDAVSVSWGYKAGVGPTQSPRGYRGGPEWATLDAVQHGTPVLVSSGNGIVGNRPHPPEHCSTYTNPWKGPAWVTRIGAAVEDGRASWWHCVPVEGIAETYVPVPHYRSLQETRESGGTSASSPNALGHLAHLLLRAREAGVGTTPPEVLRYLLNASRHAPLEVNLGTHPSTSPTAQVVQGFGVVDQAALDRAWERLREEKGPEPRPELDAWRRTDHRIRTALWGPGSATSGWVWTDHVTPWVHDDAGSGTDAPNGPSTRVRVEPGPLYWGNMTVGASGPHSSIYDFRDWYAFDAQAGDEVRFWASTCAIVVEPDGDRHSSLCSWSLPSTEVAFEAPEDGTYHIGFSMTTPETYRFALTLDGSDPLPHP